MQSGVIDIVPQKQRIEAGKKCTNEREEEMGSEQRRNEKLENKIEHGANDRVAQLEKNTAQAHLETKCGKVKSWMKHTLR